MAIPQPQTASLRALHSTATDILDLLDVDQVFSSANQRAQALLESDIAYLAVFDESSGRTMVRASIGVRSPDFGLLNVPLGAGVGGIVANSKQPFITPDYISDATLIHLPRVDAGIAAEGIRAMVAVPLIARDEFLGALFVADRRVRHYTPEEIGNLQALCALVAIAIVNARLFESKERALRDIHTAYDALKTRAAATERIVTLHDKFAAIVNQGGDCNDLIKLLARSLDIDLVLYDGAAQTLASHSGNPAALPPPCAQSAVDAAVRRSLDSGELEEIDTPPDSREYLALAIAVHRHSYGTLLAASRRILLGTERRTLERAGHIAALLLSQRHLSLLRTAQKHDEFLRLCMAGTATHKHLRKQAEALGLDIEQPATVAALDDQTPACGNFLPDLAGILTPAGAIAGKLDGKVIMLVPGQSGPPLQALKAQLEHRLGAAVTMGLAHCAEAVSQMRPAAQRAIQALAILQTSGKAGSAASFDSLGCEALLLNGNSRDDIARYIEHTLGPLQRYDRERRKNLVLTLRQYFLSGQNTQGAADALGIHPKTMVQRLDRIGRLLGGDWRRPQQSLQLQLALRVLELIDTEAGGADGDAPDARPERG